jgi:hypothetical protein
VRPALPLRQPRLCGGDRGEGGDGRPGPRGHRRLRTPPRPSTSPTGRRASARVPSRDGRL